VLQKLSWLSHVPAELEISEDQLGPSSAFVTNNMSLLFFFDMCLPYAFHFYLSEHEFTCRNTQVTKHMLNMCGKHTFTSYLQHVERAVHACLDYLLILFKPVVSGCISLASY
jgi:hypothetical protein